MPYQAEHSCRLRNPSDFQKDSFRRTKRKATNGKEYSVISGKLKNKSTMTEQAYRYKKKTWQEGEARNHCKDHKGSFEPTQKDKDGSIIKRNGEKKMHILDILTSPWAIIPEKLFEIQEIYSTHLRGEKIDFKGIAAKIDNVSENKDKRYQVIEQFAVIPLHGIIAKRMNLFSQISGGVSTELVGNDIREALQDDEVNGIVLDIDSPGGTVDGTQELAEIIYNARKEKPIISFTDGYMASAAYYIGAAAHEVYVSGDMPQIGSIGVVATHVDRSKFEEKIGFKTTEVYAGKYKRIASAYKPLSKEGKASIQDQVDYVYSIFVDDVAKYRGVSADAVLDNMADGKIFIGKQAVRAGLVDGVSTFDQLIKTRLPVLQSEMEEENKLIDFNNSLRKE